MECPISGPKIWDCPIVWYLSNEAKQESRSRAIRSVVFFFIRLTMRKLSTFNRKLAFEGFHRMRETLRRHFLFSGKRKRKLARTSTSTRLRRNDVFVGVLRNINFLTCNKHDQQYTESWIGLKRETVRMGLRLDCFRVKRKLIAMWNIFTLKKTRENYLKIYR